MKRISVNSSNIASIGHDSSINTLEVEFLNGGVYHYFGVPSSVYNSLMGADSHGKFLNAYIKGTYSYQKVI